MRFEQRVTSRATALVRQMREQLQRSGMEDDVEVRPGRLFLPRWAGILGMGFGVWGMRFGVWSLGYGVWGMGFGV